MAESSGGPFDVTIESFTSSCPASIELGPTSLALGEERHERDGSLQSVTACVWSNDRLVVSFSDGWPYAEAAEGMRQGCPEICAFDKDYEIAYVYNPELVGADAVLVAGHNYPDADHREYSLVLVQGDKPCAAYVGGLPAGDENAWEGDLDSALDLLLDVIAAGNCPEGWAARTESSTPEATESPNEVSGPVAEAKTCLSQGITPNMSKVGELEDSLGVIDVWCVDGLAVADWTDGTRQLTVFDRITGEVLATVEADALDESFLIESGLTEKGAASILALGH